MFLNAILENRSNSFRLQWFFSWDKLDIFRIIPECAGLDLLPIPDLTCVPPLTNKDVFLLESLGLLSDVVPVLHHNTLTQHFTNRDRIENISLHHFFLKKCTCRYVKSFTLAEKLPCPYSFISALSLEEPVNVVYVSLHARIFRNNVHKVSLVKLIWI